MVLVAAGGGAGGGGGALSFFTPELPLSLAREQRRPSAAIRHMGKFIFIIF